MIKSVARADILSKRYDIPKEEILLMGLNLCGVNYRNNTVIKRGRFEIRPRGLEKPFFFAMTVTVDSPFYHNGNNVFLGGEAIGSASELVEDTCTDTYHRDNWRHFTINSNLRSKCKGCKFCGTSELRSEEHDLLTREAMRQSAREMISRGGRVPESLGLVTACFSSEHELVEHLLMLRDVYEEFGFDGEVRYIGSQLTSPKSLDLLANDGKFALYFSIEAFGRRSVLMKPEKAKITLDASRRILSEARSRGIETSMLYILGLDSLKLIRCEFPKYLGILTRHPLVQLIQNYIPQHELLKNKEARSLDYYLKARKFIEGIFGPANLYPQGWDNYRAPWYWWYGGRRLT